MQVRVMDPGKKPQEVIYALKSVAQNIADTWGVDLTLLFADGNASTRRARPDTVFVHIFSAPFELTGTNEGALKRTNLGSVFGYKLPKKSAQQHMVAPIGGDNNIPIGNVVDVYKPREDTSSIHCIRSPESEGDIIAAVTEGNIYILLDVMLESWHGREVVFSALLEEAMPHALHAPQQPFGEDAVANYTRERFNIKRRELTQQIAPEEFASLVLTPSVKSLEASAKEEHNLRKIINELEERIVSEAGILYAAREELVEYEEGNEAESEDLIAREFDELLRMRLVRGVRARLEPDPVVEVTTDRIFNTGNSSEGKDIGEFQILINLNATTNASLVESAFTFGQPRYRGDYKHPNIKTLCFGGSKDGGLRSPITKLLADKDIVRTVHLVLTFLERDEDKTMEKRDDQEATKYMPPPPFYDNDADKARERQNYVRLAQEVRYMAKRKELEEQVIAKQNTVAELEAELVGARRALRRRHRTHKQLYRQVRKIRENVLHEWERLQAHSDICSVECSEEYITIAFLARSKNKYKFPVYVWIRPERGVIWIRAARRTGKFMTKGGQVMFPKGGERRIDDLLAKGRLVDVAIRVWDFFTGERQLEEVLSRDKGEI